jgi:hypothetical protein
MTVILTGKNRLWWRINDDFISDVDELCVIPENNYGDIPNI